MPISKFELNPEAVNRLLQDEADGRLPEIWKPQMEKLRAAGLLPPAMPLGPVNTTGKVLPNRKVTSLPAIPAPKQSMIGKAYADFMDWGEGDDIQNALSSAGKYAYETITQPGAVGATIGGIGGGYVGHPIAGAAVGAAADVGLRDMYGNTQAMLAGKDLPHPPLNAGVDIASAALIGGGTEALGGLANKVIRRPVTPEGQAVENFFGRKNVMAQQLTNSPALDFMANVAKYGPGGRQIIKQQELEQSQRALEHLDSVADFLNSRRGLSIDPTTGEFDAGMAGQQYQQDVARQLKEAPQKSGYGPFLEQHGDLQRTTVVPLPDEFGGAHVTKGPKVSASHAARSEELAYGRNPNISRADRQAAMEAASGHLSEIEKALPPDAFQEYSDIANRYRGEIERIDNPTVEGLRTGPANDIVDNLLKGKLTNYENLSTKTGHTTAELVKKVRAAATPEAWEQLQADTVHGLGEAALDKNSGMLDFKKMRDILHGLDEPTKRALFGKQALSDINTTLGVLEQAQKYTESEAGRLFIAIRTGQAGIKVATAGTALGAGIIGGAAAGQREGHPVLGGVAGALTVLMAPNVFAKMLTSEVGRTLLTRGASAASDSAAKQTVKAMLRFAAHNAAQGGREAVGMDQVGLPEPPASTPR